MSREPELVEFLNKEALDLERVVRAKDFEGTLWCIERIRKALDKLYYETCLNHHRSGENKMK